MHEAKIIRTKFRPEGDDGLCSLEGHPDLPVGSTDRSIEDGRLWSPTAMLLAATESCFFLTLKNVAKKMRIEIKSFSSEATGTLSFEDGKHGEFTEIKIKPKLELADESNADKIPTLYRIAEDYCYVARSLKAQITVEF